MAKRDLANFFAMLLLAAIVVRATNYEVPANPLPTPRPGAEGPVLYSGWTDWRGNGSSGPLYAFANFSAPSGYAVGGLVTVTVNFSLSGCGYPSNAYWVELVYPAEGAWSNALLTVWPYNSICDGAGTGQVPMGEVELVAVTLSRDGAVFGVARPEFVVVHEGNPPPILNPPG